MESGPTTPRNGSPWRRPRSRRRRASDLLADRDAVHRGAVHASRGRRRRSRRAAGGSRRGAGTPGGRRVVTAQSGRRPIERTAARPSGDPAAVGEDQRAQVPGRPLADLGRSTSSSPACAGRRPRRGDRHRPDELVALVPGVLAGRVGELAGERVGVGREALEVVGGEVDDDVVGHDRTPLDAERAAVRRARAAIRRPISTGWSPLRKALVKVPSTSRSSRRSNPWSPIGREVYCALPYPPWPNWVRGLGDSRGRLVRCGAPTSGEWRNWQTRRLQVPVSERMWGFKSPLAHVLSLLRRVRAAASPLRTRVAPPSLPGSSGGRGSPSRAAEFAPFARYRFASATRRAACGPGSLLRRSRAPPATAL